MTDELAALKNTVEKTVQQLIRDSVQAPDNEDILSSKTIEDLRALYLPRAKDLADDIASKGAFVKRRRNDLIPFHRLPNTVIAKIFSRVENWPYTSILSRMRDLASVCKLWHDVILNEPTLWPVVDVKHAAAAKMVLRRSGIRPLTVRCQEDDDSTLPFLSTVAPTAGRWKRFYYYGAEKKELAEALQAPTPEMTELYLVDDGDKTIGDHRRIALSDGALLRIIDLEGFGFQDYLSPRLRGMRRLALIGLTKHTAPTMLDLAALIASSPTLEILSIRKWKGFDEGDIAVESIPTDGTPINLPQLLVLELHGIPRDYTGYLISRIDAPKHSALFINSLPWELLFSSSTSSSCWQRLSPFISSLPNVSITYGTGGNRLSLGPENRQTIGEIDWMDDREVKPGIDIEVVTKGAPESFWSSVGDTLSSALADVPSVTLKLEASLSKLLSIDAEGNPVFTPELPPQVISGHFPFIYHLNLGLQSTIRQYAEYLSTPQSDGSWPCPNLTSVSFAAAVQSYLDLETIESFVRQRLQATEVVNDNTASGTRPKPLSEVYLPSRILPIFQRNEEFRSVSFK